MNNDFVGWIVGVAAALVAVVSFFINRLKDAKDSTKVDAKQNEQIIEIEGKIKTIEVDLLNLKTIVHTNESKTSEEFAKIERKLDKIMDLVLQLVQK
jgi:hypothetical protein